MTKVIPTDKARQGRRGRHVLLILIGGLILAFIVWGLVEIYGKAIEPSGETISATSIHSVDIPRLS